MLEVEGGKHDGYVCCRDMGKRGGTGVSLSMGLEKSGLEDVEQNTEQRAGGKQEVEVAGNWGVAMAVQRGRKKVDCLVEEGEEHGVVHVVGGIEAKQLEGHAAVWRGKGGGALLGEGHSSQVHLPRCSA